MKAVILKADGTPPFVKDISGDLESIKAEVGGWIERTASGFDDQVAVFANEEGLFLNLPVNRNMMAIHQIGLRQRVIAGNMVILGHDGPEHTDTPQEIIDMLVAATPSSN